MKNTKLTIALLTVLTAGCQALALTTSEFDKNAKHAPRAYHTQKQHYVNSKAAHKTSYGRSNVHHTSEAHAKKATTASHRTPVKSTTAVKSAPRSVRTAPRKTSSKLAMPLAQ